MATVLSFEMMNHPTQPTCQSCGTNDPNWEALYPEIGMRRCARCSSFSHFYDQKLDLSKIYSEAYFAGSEYSDYLGHRDVHTLNFKRKWKLLTRHLPKPVRLFEVGCAHGFFVDFARRNGVENAYGIDVGPEAVEFARTHFGPYFDIATPGKRPDFDFNCLVAWDVWEHLEHPFDYFSQLVSSLRVGGLLAITTVDSSSLVAKWRGRRWRQIHPPTHLHYPTMRALEHAVTTMGLKPVYHSHFGYYRALESYLAPLGLGKIAQWSTRLRTAPIYLDLKDTQIMVATKE